MIGGGNTAVDAAVQAKRLGAEEVTLVYRRGAEHMSATPVEREWAQTNGVTVRFWASPLHLLTDQGAVQGIRFARGAPEGGYDPQDSFTLEADMVLKAIGQVFVPDPIQNDQILVENGRIVVDANGRTSMPGVYAAVGQSRSGILWGTLGYHRSSVLRRWYGPPLQDGTRIFPA